MADRLSASERDKLQARANAGTLLERVVALEEEVARLRSALVTARGDIREMAGGDPWSGDGDSPEQRITTVLDGGERIINDVV